ncbi:MAG TPA: BamA/TamA family outer membrane protein, partial [Longimicrobiaceae bacterium]|nr:BamA/TamA family outer membrane protein [Longimicrobiaceae bacterium]
LALALALAALGGCARAGAPAGPLPQFAEYAGREIKRVTFAGDSLLVPRDSLDKVVTTQASTCRFLFIPICPLGVGDTDHFLDLQVLARDVVRIQLLYRDYGYYGTRVVPHVDDAGEDKVAVRFAITPGDQVTLRELTVEGTEPVFPPAEAEERLPLKEGEPFRRIAFLASVDTLRNRLLEAGHPYAQVLRNYEIDTIYDVARVNLVASPGPLVTVDTILFTGNYRLTEEIARRQLAFDEGDKLRATDLARSQRNLYDLELVDFAAVEVAPESLQVTPDSVELLADSIGSTIVVRLAEAPRYAVDLAAGYGTLDCLRARGSHVDRNFLGGARRLEVSGLVSKVGVASPADLGLESSLCREFRIENEPVTPADSIAADIADAMNYRLAVNFLQPRLFGTRTSVVASGFVERISEFGLYLRNARGGQLGMVRQVAPQTVFTGNLTVRRGSTLATDEFFCLVYEVCTREQIDPLKESRWSNSIDLGLVRNRVRLDPFPSAGYHVRLTTNYASTVLASDDRYLRVQGDGTWYRELGSARVLSIRLMGGGFFQSLVGGGCQACIPPEQRFYAGGPTSVRGFGRNELGPRVYVLTTDVDSTTRQRNGVPFDTVIVDSIIRPSPTGGVRTALASVELTFPSFFLKDNLRLAVFVDAGQVWDEKTITTNPGVRVTPGVGGRLATPLGPFRIDVAFNPYAPPPGPLFEIGSDGVIRGPVGEHSPGGKKWNEYFALQLSLGQTF